MAKKNFIAKEKKPDKWMLIGSLEHILKKYPPPTYLRPAYSEFFSIYNRPLEITLFKKVYSSGKSAEQMLDEIFNVPKSKDKSTYETYITNRGKRGKGRNLDLIIEADKILFKTEEVMKRFNVNTDREKLFSNMWFFYNYFWDEKYSTETLHKMAVHLKITEDIMRLTLYCLNVYYDILRKVNEAIKKDPKKLKILSVMYPGGVKKRGRLSQKKTETHIKEFQLYIRRKTATQKTSRDRFFYDMKGFKCLAYIYTYFEGILDTNRKQRNEKISSNVKERLKKLSKENQADILESLLNEFFPQHVSWKGLLTETGLRRLSISPLTKGLL